MCPKVKHHKSAAPKVKALSEVAAHRSKEGGVVGIWVEQGFIEIVPDIEASLQGMLHVLAVVDSIADRRCMLLRA